MWPYFTHKESSYDLKYKQRVFLPNAKSPMSV